MPPQPPRMHSRRLLMDQSPPRLLPLRTAVRRPGVEQVPFEVLDLDDEARELSVAIGVEAGVLAGHASEAGAQEGVADCGALLGELSGVAGAAGLLRRLLQQI